MLLVLSAEVLKHIHQIVIRQRGEPGYMTEGMIQGCIERAMTDVYDFQPFPTVIKKAAAFLYSMIVFHPFIDGNKRTALIGTFWLLYFNGYSFSIPKDTVSFLRAIADLRISENQVASWLMRNTTKNLFLSLYNHIYSILAKKHMSRIMEAMKTLVSVIPPGYPEVYRGYSRKKKVSEITLTVYTAISFA